MYEHTLGQVLWLAFRDTIESLLIYLPLVFGGLLIFVGGWVAAGLIGRGVERLGEYLGLDYVWERLRLNEPLMYIWPKQAISHALGMLVRWLLIFLLLSAVAEALHLSAVTGFLQSLVSYLPHLVSAIVILMIGVLAAGVLDKLTTIGVVATRFGPSDLLGAVIRWSVLIFSFLAAARELGVSNDLIQTVITGFVAMLAIAGGIAFGLGGKDYVTGLISKINRDFTRQ
ncbi:hypothetical protein A3H10_02130 [Candidatus Uhrbacteria bacterium RIFCSPLOWO2_12_FULL_46_10]|uniref:Small-conductance mechanosensitive ion channel n=1 Tax=Candidatus Uhrbacteria bacterium RIFCSPLOWO2_01_FULL_47_25 TaxID=1802402 RepID=A0A1F7UXH8_9BACT|nr:MAG: hypothetical protein UX68_C0032G0012 [Parcubacteria group bacterium GW2011_GWA2_46_9]OGL60683.1 MAG: hypothetical protein A2752_04285 [Candidatus Uhrbacteria bacterium RIFCSPHIGHO2_01_FULL_46_23]OGL70314.1 MAG: hypothetical protein A3D60_01800 [Candidatus Uhrbacteria bacterium RIFCSPHIGHO2_02_FULL_47_29]OGL75100.1 MAG: hypothetical protein A3E96_01830 [Candidatus Uhrbacteria bacterium RIFCSPHIGHO2_12_FULL_46_13]OGL83001.1 MAG: hypothetical protein A2936_03545 [Candidatus Uhrbacteria bac